MTYTLRPLSDRTWLRPERARKNSQFDSTWTQTLTLLQREVSLLLGKNLVIEVDVTEAEMRLNGELRSSARPASPAVVVAFDSTRHGPQLFRADKYVAPSYKAGPGWHHNVRAVALTLEYLRAVDRHGAAETGQQYTGFRAIEGGRPLPPPTMSREEAAKVVSRWSGETPADGRVPWDVIILDSAAAARAMKRAKARTHPDTGAARVDWDLVNEACRALLGLGS